MSIPFSDFSGRIKRKALLPQLLVHWSDQWLGFSFSRQAFHEICTGKQYSAFLQLGFNSLLS
jgi:hypothetical protein